MNFIENKYLYVLLTFTFFCASSVILGQNIVENDGLPSGLFHKYNRSTPDEKYIINTDRDIYFINESIWFNVWSIDDVTNIPVTRSRVLYIELIGKDGVPIDQQSIIVTNNLASGRIVIPVAASSGVYYIRAYSNWQKNFGMEHFGVKLVQIINPYNPPQNIMPANPEVKLTCFPEGGRLVYGINNKVIVEARYDNGNFADQKKAEIFTGDGEFLTRINWLAKGIGYFYITPVKSKTFYLKYNENSTLPVSISDSGMFVQLSTDSAHIELTLNGIWDEGDNDVYLVGKNENKIFFEKKVIPHNLPEVLRFHLTEIPGGLSVFSLLKGNSTLLSQRLFYKLKDDSPSLLKVVVEKSMVSTRDSVILTLHTPYPDRIGGLALSVRKRALQFPYIIPGLQADILLHSGINDWDFFKQLELSQTESNIMDLVNDYLITKSNTRHTWAKMASFENRELKFPAEISHRYISGVASDPVLNKTLHHNKLLMYFVSQIPYMLMSNTDEMGRFRFSEPLRNFGKQEILLQATHSGVGLNVEFDWPYFEEYYPYNLNLFYFDSVSIKEMDESFFTWQLNMLHRDYHDKFLLKEPVPEKLSFYGNPDRRFYLDDYIPFNDLTEVFKEIVENVRVRSRGDNYSVIITNPVTERALGSNPLLLFNGHVIDDFATVLAIPVKNIKVIDVITNKFYIGEAQFDGVVNIVPKDIMIKTNVPIYTYRSIIDLTNEKYSFGTPVYNSDQRIPFPDFRNTLYWNPEIKPEGQTTRIVLFSGDNKGEFEIEVKGIGTNGEIIQVTKKIEIE